MPRPKPNCDNLLNEHIFSKGFKLSKELDKDNFNKNTLIYIQCKNKIDHVFVTNMTDIIRKQIILDDFCPHCKKEKRYNEMGIPLKIIEEYSQSNNLEFSPKKDFYNRWEDKIIFTCKKCNDSFEVKSLAHFEKAKIGTSYECESCNLKEKGIKSEIETKVIIEQLQNVSLTDKNINLLETHINKEMSLGFTEKLKQTNWHIVNYNGTKLKGEFQCKICGNITKTLPYNLFGNGGCSKCAKLNVREGVYKRMAEICEITNIYPKKAIFYENIETPIEFKCNNCGNEFAKSWSHINASRGTLSCPECFKGTKRKQQTEVQDFIEKLLERNISSNRRDLIPPLEIDIYDDITKVGIEFCGLNWHSTEYKSDNNCHKVKYERCKENGIRLVTIFGDEWELKRNICQSRLRNLFGKTSIKIGARNTECIKIDNVGALKFCEENHIQGKGSAHESYGLIYNEELISVMTFSKPSASKSGDSSDYQWELNRFCSKLDMNIMGGANKLFQEFRKNHKNEKLITFCDLRWGTGDVYEKMGFTFDYMTKPNYYYIGEILGRERKHRFNFTKQKLLETYKGDPLKTEEQLANENGLHRIFDCGHTRFHIIL